jgi:hypothetical protein
VRFVFPYFEEDQLLKLPDVSTTRLRRAKMQLGTFGGLVLLQAAHDDAISMDWLPWECVRPMEGCLLWLLLLLTLGLCRSK